MRISGMRGYQRLSSTTGPGRCPESNIAEVQGIPESGHAPFPILNQGIADSTLGPLTHTRPFIIALRPSSGPSPMPDQTILYSSDWVHVDSHQFEFPKYRTNMLSTLSRLHINTLWKRKSASDKNIHMRDILIFPVVIFVNFFSDFSCLTNTIVCHACKFFHRRDFSVNTHRF